MKVEYKVEVEFTDTQEWQVEGRVIVTGHALGYVGWFENSSGLQSALVDGAKAIQTSLALAGRCSEVS